MEQEIITENYIDVQKVLGAKGVKLPHFVEKILARLLHVKDLNAGIYNNREKFGLDFVYAFVEGKEPYNLGMKVFYRGLENVPQEGCPMVVGNHPLGGPDGLALMGAVGHKRTDILFPVTDFLLYIPGLRQLFVPIDKVNRSKTLANLEEAFAGQNILLYYPSGAASRRHKGVVKDLEWQATFIKKAVKYQRDVVPVYTEARNRNIFYIVANLRERLGIKFKYEMAMLPAEMFAQRGKSVDITFGKPIPYTVFDKRHTPAEWAALMREHVYKLKENPEEVFSVKC